jgi:inorganic pyrophosphatase
MKADMCRKLWLIIFLGCTVAAFAESSNPGPGSMKVVGERNFLTGYPATVREGVINVVVEIPAGTNEKWETSADGTSIHWEIKNDKPRIVQFLPYPGNYGLVPRTLLSKNIGGDGDPLDVIVLGGAVPRGSVVEATPIAVLSLLDGGEQDDKILAVPLSGPLSDVTSLESLNRMYPGATEVVRIWFTGYKGGETVTQGYKDSTAAWNLINLTENAFDQEAASITAD